ncbi:cytochrome P450 monooxygenase pc-3 [Dichomitus squalens LYAD-421 SS1]|uniref:Cytochrome P450 monooxygenase pc-3 n=1 Tax=Dichomitus squalens (strain LYAD-421) TaxID=732165 RepID=R7SJL3_DICSQ|nr:cytochrome P450 monooxygenase pc-3 [Dichomitus squalens LYAD-421 SS1]EJF56346.1 cytochrome P450 monooxygenase pc-3 [Dichomitus squalens LYAD-421 SS1]
MAYPDVALTEPLPPPSPRVAARTVTSRPPTPTMPPSLPPGPRYLLRQLPSIIFPPAIAHGLLQLISAHLSRRPPSYLFILAYVLSWPLAFTALVQWRAWKARRDAAASGALIPQEVDHKLPGSVDLIVRMFQEDAKMYLVENLFRYTEKYGNTFNLRVLFEDRMFTCEPEHIKTMLATEFTHYEKGPLLFGQLNTLLGSGVFNSDGEMWKFHRTMTRPFFSKDRITHFDIFDRHAEHALNKVASRLKEGVPVDWQDIVSRFTMDSATEFLFGKDVRSLDAPIPYPSTYRGPNATRADKSSVHPADRFVQAFQNGLEATAIRGRFLQSWPLFEFWGDKVEEHLAAVHEFIDPIVGEALRKKAERQRVEEDIEKDVRDDETLLEHLVKFTDDGKVLKDETLNILLAGRDTTACTLTFAVFALAEHADVLRRLREEVLDVVGPSRRPTYDDIREMKYMRAFINEVLRLYPPVPLNSRCSIQGMTWKNPTDGQPDWYIPPRVRCLYSVLLMHRRKDLWGPDALSFDPDRFIDDRVQKYLVPNPFIFLPFNAGPRICLGQQFAYNEASFMLVRLLQRFSDIKLRQDAHPESMPPPGVERSPYAVDGLERVWMRSHLTTYAKNGLWVEMQETSA